MFKAFVVAATAAVAATSAQAQSDYPNRVIKIVTPYVAGSVPDVFARALVPGLSSRLGQQFIVENRTGGSGAIGTLSVVRAEPDGYTVLMAPAVVLSVLPQARGVEAGYRPDSLVPVCQTFVNTMGLAVRPNSAIRDVKDLVAAARQKPGVLNYGHPGVLTIPHLAVEELLQAAEIDIKDIPFRGGPQSIAELLGGRIDVVTLVMGTEVGQNVRIIGVFSGRADRQGAGLRRHAGELRRAAGAGRDSGAARWQARGGLHWRRQGRDLRHHRQARWPA
jgi:tripartite-type tricarboxylate transporter receptor subunit TctC